MKSAVFIIIFFLPFFALSQNVNDLRPQTSYLKQLLNLKKFYNSTPHHKKIKVAILDKGFLGWETAVGKTLPPTTYFFPGPLEQKVQRTEHGLRMAQIFTSLVTDDLLNKSFVLELYLYNVFGFSNFQFAIQDLITKEIDLVLYSEVWEFGGNSDGQGFINYEVNKAIEKNITWINAAGNFEQSTFSAPVRTQSDDWVDLPKPNESLQIRCRATQNKKCFLRIVLSWNDFKNDFNLGTDKDLDFILTDELLNILQTGALKQSDDPTESRPGYSKYPREIIEAEVPSGVYLIRIKNRSKNFINSDQLKITVDGNDFEMSDRTTGESLLNPADNSGVITVGASDSPKSSSSTKLNKPDLLTPSKIQLTNGDEFLGSSNSAAIAAAITALIKTQAPVSLSKNELLSVLRPQYPIEKGLWLNELYFAPTGPGCFVPYITSSHPLPTFVTEFLTQTGSHFVQTTYGGRILSLIDPLKWGKNLQRKQKNDMVVLLPTGGLQVHARNSRIPAQAIEVFQTPMDAGLCRSHSGSAWNAILNLPFPTLPINRYGFL